MVLKNGSYRKGEFIVNAKKRSSRPLKNQVTTTVSLVRFSTFILSCYEQAHLPVCNGAEYTSGRVSCWFFIGFDYANRVACEEYFVLSVATVQEFRMLFYYFLNFRIHRKQLFFGKHSRDSGHCISRR